MLWETLSIKVSVLIPVLNGAQTIARQLDALANSETTLQWEVIIADNGSNDDTVAVVGQHPLARRGCVRIVDAGRQRGVNVARNEGVRASSADLILICDSDDEVGSQWISKHVQRLVQQGADIVAGPLRTTELNGDRARSWSEGLDAPITVGPYLSGFGANFGFRRAVWERIGGFDETFVNGFDEIDFMVRAQKCHATFQWVEDASVSYRLPTTLRHLWRRSYRSGLMSVLFADRHRDVVSQPFRRAESRRLRKSVWVLAKRLATGRGGGRSIAKVAFSLGVLRGLGNRTSI